MKINKVCELTGLTERTIRFYIEKGLLQTKMESVNGRINRDFTQENVDILIDISKLRKAGFSIQDIMQMQQNVQNTKKLVWQHRVKLEEEQDFRCELIHELKEIEKRGDISWRKLASILYRDEIKSTFCIPPDDIEYKEPYVSEKLTAFKLGFKIFLVLISVFAIIMICLQGIQGKKKLTFDFLLSDVVFEDKWRDEDGQMYVLAVTSECSSLEYQDYFSNPQTLKLQSDEYYSAIQTNSMAYTSLHIWIEMDYFEAKERGVLDENGDMEIKKILSNSSLITQYCTIRTLSYDE